MIDSFSPSELKQRLDPASGAAPIVLDVRDDWEYEICRIPGSQNLPMHQIPDRLAELPRDIDIVVVCHHGVRSLHVAQFLQGAGYSRVRNLKGGIAAWAEQVDPEMPRY